MKLPVTESNKTQDFLIVSLVLFFIYVLSLPRTVVLEDDGLFLMAAWFNGIAHPPGYPLYTLLSHMVTWVPLGSVALRVHMFTALIASLGCGVLYLILKTVTHDRLIAVCVSIIFGLSAVYWSQAIIAEVYSLNALIFLILLLLAINYSSQDSKVTKRSSALFGLVYGAGLANHWPLILLSTPALLLILLKDPKKLIRHLKFFVPGAVIGMLPYIWMIYRSQMDPVFSFYGPINSIMEFWFVISREGFSSVDNNLSAHLLDKFSFMVFAIKESVFQFGIIGFILVLAGMIYQRKLVSLRFSIALFLAYLFNTLVLILLLNFDFDYLHQNIFKVYPIIAYVTMAIWLAIGIVMVTKKADKFENIRLKSSQLKAMLLLLILGSTVTFSYPENWRSDDIEAEVYAKIILENLDQGSSLFLNDDFSVLPVGYMNKVSNSRPDIELFQSYGLLFNNRLFRGDNKISGDERSIIINDYINQADYQIYYDTLPEHPYAVDEFGLFSRVNKSGQKGEYEFIFNEDIASYFIYVLSRDDIVNPWVKMLYQTHQRNFCYLISGLAEYTSQADKKAFFNNLIDRFCNGYYGSVGLIKRMLLDDQFDNGQVEKIIQTGISSLHEAVSKKDMSMIYNFQGLIYLSSDEMEKAMNSLDLSLRIWDHPDNDAHHIRDSVIEFDESD